MDKLQHTISIRGKSREPRRAIERMNFSSLYNTVDWSVIFLFIYPRILKDSQVLHSQKQKGVSSSINSCVICSVTPIDKMVVEMSQSALERSICWGIIRRGGLFKRDATSQVWESSGVNVVGSYDEALFTSRLELLDNKNSKKKLAVGLAGLFHNPRSSKSTSDHTLGKIVLNTINLHFSCKHTILFQDLKLNNIQTRASSTVAWGIMLIMLLPKGFQLKTSLSKITSNTDFIQY